VNPRRLYRSRTDRTIAGVAGGMADYLEVDPTIVRILWILAAIFTGGLMLLLYILLAFVVPTNPYPAGAYPGGSYPGGPTPAGAGYAPGAQAGWSQQPPTAPGTAAWSPDWNARYEAERAARAERPGRAGLIIGTVLIVFGIIALADVALPSWIGGALFGPAILLAIGAALLVVSLRKPDAPVAASSAAAATPGTTAYAAPAGETPAYEAPAYDAPAPVPPAPVADPDATAPVPDLTASDPT
jgi:phage shock protein C